MKLKRLAPAVALLSFLALANHRQQAASFISAAPFQTDVAQTTAIVGATLIDGSGNRPVPNSVVLIKGDSILAAGRRGAVKVPADAELIKVTLALAPAPPEEVGGVVPSPVRVKVWVVEELLVTPAPWKLRLAG